MSMLSMYLTFPAMGCLPAFEDVHSKRVLIPPSDWLLKDFTEQVREEVLARTEQWFVERGGASGVIWTFEKPSSMLMRHFS